MLARKLGVDLGVLEAVHLHAAACAAACTLPSDIFGRRIREHDLLVNPIEISGGVAVVPRTAGLGVSLDLDAVARVYDRRGHLRKGSHR